MLVSVAWYVLPVGGVVGVAGSDDVDVDGLVAITVAVFLQHPTISTSAIRFGFYSSTTISLPRFLPGGQGLNVSCVICCWQRENRFCGASLSFPCSSLLQMPLVSWHLDTPPRRPPIVFAEIFLIAYLPQAV